MTQWAFEEGYYCHVIDPCSILFYSIPLTFQSIFTCTYKLKTQKIKMDN